MDDDTECSFEPTRKALTVSIYNDDDNTQFDTKNQNILNRPHSLSVSWTKESFNSRKTNPVALERWFKAVSKICHQKTCNEIYPWQNFPINSTKTEKAIRYRYSALRRKWVQDEILVKLEMLPFDHGAMRECFRLKKFSTTHKNSDWCYASNYVAKNYIKDVKREVYFEDVKLQMEAKLWAEEYNRHNPPKKIDIFQLSVIELTERNNKPCYHIEHFMDGSYRKYNSNSGFVDDTCIRNTPQAFSHFTFERSGHRMMVVDIQGVGDLYTDPQIHTADGLNYGDGNLGLRGMSLFFSTHRCNPICQYLNLSEFDMDVSELITHEDKLSTSHSDCNENGDNVFSNNHNTDNIKPENDEYSCSLSIASSLQSAPNKQRQRSISFKLGTTVVKEDVNIEVGSTGSCRRRTRTCNTGGNGTPSSPAFLDDLYPPPLDLMRAMSVDSGVLSDSTHLNGNMVAVAITNDDKDVNNINTNVGSLNHHGSSIGSGYSSAYNYGCNTALLRCWMSRGGRQRNSSDCSDVDYLMINNSNNNLYNSTNLYGSNEEIDNSMGVASVCHVNMSFHWLRENQHKPACTDHPTNLDEEVGHSILAQVHHEMARLHESGRIALQSAQYNRPADRSGVDDIHYHNFWAHLVDTDEQHNNDNKNISFYSGLPPKINWQACLFHERQAAQLGCLEAVIMMARYGLEMGDHMLQDCPLPPTDMDQLSGLEYLWRAADSGDRRSMIELANRYCIGLSTESVPLLPCDWSEAVRWYRRAYEAANKTEGQLDDRDAEGKYDSAGDLMPVQEILAVMAKLYMAGGYGLEIDFSMAGDLYSEAAEIATNAGNGRRATKFYELADEAYSNLE